MIEQILERFGIALTNNIGLQILVKNPDKLPWIAVIGWAEICEIVGRQPADLVTIANQLLAIVFIRMLLNDRNCIRGGVADSLSDRRIYFVLSRCIFLLYREFCNTIA